MTIETVQAILVDCSHPSNRDEALCVHVPGGAGVTVASAPWLPAFISQHGEQSWSFLLQGHCDEGPFEARLTFDGNHWALTGPISIEEFAVAAMLGMAVGMPRPVAQKIAVKSWLATWIERLFGSFNFYDLFAIKEKI